MDDGLGSKLLRTAGHVAQKLGKAAQVANERVGELREAQHLQQQITQRKDERERCRQAMVDLLIRMFDQNTFSESLLRPDYLHIKELDAEICSLEAARARIGEPVPEESPVPVVIVTEKAYAEEPRLEE